MQRRAAPAVPRAGRGRYSLAQFDIALSLGNVNIQHAKHVQAASSLGLPPEPA